MGVVLGPNPSPCRAEDLGIDRGHGNTNGEKGGVVDVEKCGVPGCDLDVEHTDWTVFQDKAMSRLPIDGQRCLRGERGCGKEDSQGTRKSSASHRD